MIGIVAFGLVSAIISTCDSFLLIASQALIFEWTDSGKKINSRLDLENENINNVLGKKGKNLVPVIMGISIILFILVSLLAIPLVSVIFLLLSFQTVIAPLAIIALYHKDSAQNMGNTAIFSLFIVTILIFSLFILSGTASSVSMSYAFSYFAPIVAIFVPIIIFMVQGVFIKNNSGLLKIAHELFLSKK